MQVECAANNTQCDRLLQNTRVLPLFRPVPGVWVDSGVSGNVYKSLSITGREVTDHLHLLASDLSV